LRDRLDPDPAEPATSFEQALDSLDPVAPAAAARPLEDALDEMDPGLLETVPDGLPAAELETPAPAVHEPVDWSADSLEPHAFYDESVDGGELQVAEEDGPADMAAEQVFMADEVAADLDPYLAFDPDVAATAAGDDAEDDPQVIEQGAIETLAADPDTGEEPGSLSEDDGREWDAYSLDEDTDQEAEPVAPSEDDADNNELAELLRALEEQTRTEGQTLSAVRPDDEPLDESVEESPGEDLELPPADASAEREPFDSDADAELELPESSEPVGPELAGPGGGGDVADFEVEGEAVAGGDGVEPVPIGVQIAGAAAEQDPGSVAIDVDVGSIDYDPGTAIEYLAAGETQTGLESPGEATPRPAEEPFTAVELQVEDEFATGLPLIELVVPVHAASEEDFEEIRITVLDGAAEAIRAGLARAEDLIAAGELAQAKALLQDAMCALPLRHAAGARLARVYRETGDFASAMECLEWVAEREPADEAAGHELAYELAVTLEAMGQRDHALGIYRELLSEVGAGFRDVAARARQLAAA
jgi:tetratricopeptide (TPR) repeat protein